MDIIYKGYSTHNYNTLGGTFSVTNQDLVNLDILSHIYTETDERVMMPGWGTDIPNKAFEPLTVELVEDIHDELDRVIDYDPRVEKIKISVVPAYDQNSIIATVTLRYIELNIVNDLSFVINLETGNG